MFVISLHGLEGQGVEDTTKNLAAAAVSAGLNAQAFYESSSKTVTGFVKIDKNPILSRQKEVDDFSLIFTKHIDLRAVLSNVREKGMIILNTSEKFSHPLAKKKKIKMFALDAGAFGRKQGTVMLGGLVKNFNKLSMKNIKNVTGEETIIEEGYRNVKAVK